jgi:hypothetical protein
MSLAWSTQHCFQQLFHFSLQAQPISLLLHKRLKINASSDERECLRVGFIHKTMYAYELILCSMGYQLLSTIILCHRAIPSQDPPFH